MSTSDISISILLPAFNEGNHLYQNVIQIRQALVGIDPELILIDDGSQDDTYAQATAAAQLDDRRIRVLKLEKNCGKGAALVNGFQLSTGDYVAFLDADLEIQPEYVAKMLETLQRDGKDLIVGRKIYVNAQIPLLRRIMSRIYRMYVGILFSIPLHDTQTGIKVFRRQVLDICIPKMTVSGFAFDVELLALAQKAGFQMDEYPVELTYKRTRSLERIKVMHILRMFTDTLKIFFELHR